MNVKSALQQSYILGSTLCNIPSVNLATSPPSQHSAAPLATLFSVCWILYVDWQRFYGGISTRHKHAVIAVLWDSQYYIWLIPGRSFELQLFALLRSCWEILWKNVWENRMSTETSVSEADVTKRIQEMRQTWRSERLSGLVVKLHLSAICLHAARTHVFAFHRPGVMLECTCLACAPPGKSAF